MRNPCIVANFMLLSSAMVSKERKKFGNELRVLRGKMTLRTAGVKTGYSFTWLSKLESGTRFPSWNALQEIVQCYAGKSVDMGAWAAKHFEAMNSEKFKLAMRYQKTK